MHLSILNFKIYWFYNIKIFYSNSILYSENVNIKIFPEIDYALVACDYCLLFFFQITLYLGQKQN